MSYLILFWEMYDGRNVFPLVSLAKMTVILQDSTLELLSENLESPSRATARFKLSIQKSVIGQLLMYSLRRLILTTLLSDEFETRRRKNTQIYKGPINSQGNTESVCLSLEVLKRRPNKL